MSDESVVAGYDSPVVKDQLQTVNTELERRALFLIAEHDKKLDQIYSEKLKKEERLDRESVVISLDEIPPDDKETRVVALGKKLDEYTNRYKSELMELEIVGAINTMYKRDILRLVLTHGKVNTWAYSDAVAEQYDMVLTQRYFGNAAGVVHDYIRTGGVNLINGGLQET